MTTKRALQFELWEECNNQCDFCYLRDGNIKTDNSLKIKSLDLAISKISDMNTWDEYNVISYIGGEFFLGQLEDKNVRERFVQLIDKTSLVLSMDRVVELWLNATMTIGDLSDLFDCLRRIERKDKIWLCTSYDTIGRFHTLTHLDTWERTMAKIEKDFPQIRRNVSIILTGDLIDRYLLGRFSFKEFKQRYSCSLFLKTPGTGGYPTTVEYKKKFNSQILENFFPTRDKFLSFLTKFRREESLDDYDKIYNINYRADDLYKNTSLNHEDFSHFKRVKDGKMNDYKVVDGDLQAMTLSKCGHRSIYTPYVDSDCCFVCDKEMIECMI